MSAWKTKNGREGSLNKMDVEMMDDLGISGV
jgi:hypothetical protein